MCLEIWIMGIAVSNVSSSSFVVVVVRHTQKILPIVHAAAGARARARQMASGGFAISISGTTNRSEIMESRVLKICTYCTIDRIIPPVHFWRF